MRLAFARLAHDLRGAVTLGATTPATLLGQSERLSRAWPIRTFANSTCSDRCSSTAGRRRAGSDLPALREVHAVDIILRGLPVFSLHGTTNLILKESRGANELPPEPAASVLRAITERMLKMPSSRQVDETLRAMCRRKIVAITRLPVELQEWVLAENWVEALRTEQGKEPPKGSADSNPVRILQKGARYAFIQRLTVQATGILERIKNVAPKAVPEVFDVPTVEAVLAELPRGCGQPTGSLGPTRSRRRHRRRLGGVGHRQPAIPRCAKRRRGS